MLMSDIVTLGGLLVAFTLFIGMALQELHKVGLAAVRSIKFQLAIATFIWLIGESLTVMPGVFFGSYEEFLEIHTLSMATFAVVILIRIPKLLGRSHYWAGKPDL